MQAQGHVGVFGGVGAGLFQCDLIKGQLLAALAGDVFELDGALAQILEREAVHVVAGSGGIEHIGFEHGIEGDALHADIVMGQHIDVVLGVLRDLGLVRIFQIGLERRQHRVAVELIGNAHIAVGDRDIGGFVGFDRQRYTDQFGALGVNAGGFGVKGEQLGVLELVEPAIEIGLFGDDLVAFLGFRVVVVSAIGTRVSLGFAQQVVQPGLELHLAVQRDQRIAVNFARHQGIDLYLQLNVQFDRCQLIGEVGHLLVFLQLLGQLLGAANRQLGHLVETVVDDVQAAADTGQQAERGFFADAGHSGDVVDLVAHQRQVVDDQLRPDAEFVVYALNIHHRIGHGVDQRDVLIDQLGHVLVAGRDHDLPAGVGALPGQGADHVVSLHAVHAQQRQAERAHRRVQGLDLGTQVVGHGRAM